jgi:hypothetical protein
MKKLKSILTLTLAFGFLASVAFTSCGGKKESAEETTEQTEGEHPADSSEHPADSSEHPTEGDSTEHPANPDEEVEIKH